MGVEIREGKLRVAICDDDRAFLQVLNKRVAQFFESSGIPIELAQFSQGEKLLAWDEANAIDVLIMDIEMKTTNGLDVAYQMRALNPRFLLVFVTAFLQYAPQGYEVGGFRYVLKDRFDATIDAALKDVIHELGYTREAINLDFIAGPQTLYIDDIAYMESEKHAVNFFGATGSFLGRLYTNLSEVESRFPAGQFIRPHKSFIVNLKQVYKMAPLQQPTHFVMGSGMKIPIAQRKQAAAKKAYFIHQGKNKNSAP